MRLALLVAWLALARLAGAICLDDCLTRFGGTGPDYAACVTSCGVCGNGVLEGDEECDDGNTAAGDCCDATCHFELAGSACHDADDLCSTGICDDGGDCDSDEVPSVACREPVAAGGASLTMNDSGDDAKDLLLWTYRRGPATPLADFGEPAADTGYTLCVYDADGLEASVGVTAGGECGGHACWSQQAGGWRYRSAAREPDGAAQITLQHGRRDGRTKIVFKASGGNLDLPDLGSLASPVTVQLRRSGGLVCWGARYSFPPARRNDGAHFRDRSDPPPATTTTTSTTATSTSAPGAGGLPTTSSTLPPTATVTVTVVDSSSAPVADADVTISYAGNADDAFDFTDETGVVVFTGQPVGVAAVVSAEDDDDRTGSVSSPGFQSGANMVTVVVR
jgi:cysteine-rich repeat protein